MKVVGGFGVDDHRLRVGYAVEMSEAAVFENILTQKYDFSKLFKSFEFNVKSIECQKTMKRGI